MTDTLRALMAKAVQIKMTDSQMREQRLSFVYGNTHLANASITREMVVAADLRIAESDLVPL